MRANKLQLTILIAIALSFLGIQSNAQEAVKSVGKFIPLVQNSTAINPSPVQGGSTAIVTGTAKGVNGVFHISSGQFAGQNVYAGTFDGSVDQDATYFYCIDLSNGLKYNEPYEDNGNTSSEITYILNNYYPFVTRNDQLSDPKEEAAAVQIAIWHFSDGTSINDVNNNSDVENRAQAIIDDADANAGNTSVPATILLYPNSQFLDDGDDADFTVKVLDVNGNGIANVTVNLTSTAGTLSNNSVTTNANGEANFTVSQNNAPNAVITAEATATIPQGTKYTHKANPNSVQKLVLATPVTATAQAQAEVFWGDGTELCVEDDHGDKVTVGTLFTTTLQNGDVRIRFVLSKDYNDNTYDENANGSNPGNSVIGWPGNNHKFKHLYKSDEAVFEVFDGNDNSVIEFTLDYLEKDQNSFPSSYGPRLTNVSGNQSNIVSFTTSLSENFNNYGYVLTNASPATDANYTPNPAYPAWIFDMYYEFTVSANAFGSAGFGYVDVVEMHNSPAKEEPDGKTNPEECTSSDPASIGNKVWNDANNDGIQDNGEDGISGVTVKLFDCNDNFIAQTTTDNDGEYSFTNLTPGDYYVKFILPSGYTFSPKNSGSDDTEDSDADVSTGKTDCTTLESGENDETWDAGLTSCSSTIGNFVWHDKNINGIQDNNEPGIAGVVVKLYRNNSQVAMTTTDNNGYYEFTDLENDNYTVEIAASNFTSGGALKNAADEKWYATTPNAGNDDVDSDGDVISHRANIVIDCEDDYTVDFGFYVTSFTFNKSGDQTVNAGADITYTFTVVNTGDVVLHGGVSIFDALINPNGNHQIWNGVVNPGETKTITKTYTTTSDDCGELINNATAEGHPVLNNTNLPNITASDSWSTTVVCLQQDPAEIGDKVWLDSNENGIQDNGETGVANITVKLFKCDSTLYSVTTTNSNGEYSFTVPGTDLGDYYIEFVLPDDYTFSPIDQGNNDAVDSDADGNGKTVCTTLSSGETDLTWDAGIYELPQNADLSLSKTANNQNPEDGDQVTFTITVTNNGPADATGIEVTDLLPSGLVYVSSSATAGSYDTNSGIWTISSALAANNSEALEITATVDVEDCVTETFDLGPAKGFNLFVWRDFKAPSSDIEGKVAVGRDAELSNYSIADKLNSGYANQDVFIVNRDLYFTSGRVYFGNVTYGRSTNLPKSNVTIDGALRKEKPIDFNSARAYLKTLSSTLAAYTVNGTTAYQWSGVFLEGSDPYLNVFTVDGAELTSSTYMDIKVPNGAVVLVNVTGKNIAWSGGLSVTGTDVTNVLYNFPKAKNIQISSIDVRGSVLAPRAKVHFNNGLISGQLIAKTMTGTGQLNNYPFLGNVPCPTEITNIAEISAADQGDPDSTPGNGDETEDDYDSFTIIIDNGGNNGNGGGNNDNGSWSLASQFPFQEIVWTMDNDNQGNMLAGTIGGHLYISYNDGADWTLINQNLIVGFIWDIAVHPSTGDIYIGTEQGVFYTVNEGNTWVGPVLTGDVRAMVFDSNDNAFAGIWGLGVYKSTDDGQNWNAMNTGLSPFGLAVHSLAIDGNDDLYAGTFGGGVYKSTDGAANWNMSDVGYPYVWSVGVDSNMNVYAATYGGGVYKSNDAGDNWFEYNNGLNASYIYSVIIDANDNVYAATWLGDVYMLSNAPTPTAGGSNTAGNGWTAIGLRGLGVSSLLVNPATGTLYAGTSNGKVYMQGKSLTGVNDGLEIPVEFTLEQNYPNPFNPSTIIKFGVPKDGDYSLRVYNILGQLVATLINGQFIAGWHEVEFNANNLSSGIYIYRLQGNSVVITKKMILMK